jgi:hypothetical protein
MSVTSNTDNIGDHVIDDEQLPQQQYPLPLHSHTSSLVQQPRPNARHQLPTCGGATTNVNASNFGFQDDRIYCPYVFYDEHLDVRIIENR